MKIVRRSLPCLAIALIFVISEGAVARPKALPLADVSGEDILIRCQIKLKEASDIKGDIYRLQNAQNSSNALALYNDILIIVSDMLSESGLIAQVHPAANIQRDAETCEQNVSKFMTDVSLDRQIYEAIRSHEDRVQDGSAARMLKKTLLDFRRSGVDKDEMTQRRIKTIKEELVTVSQQFGQNISNDTFFIELDDEKQLEGLPKDYIESHRQPSGKFVIDTTYPDYVPFMKYAKSDDARRQLRFKYLNRGQKNGPVLQSLLKNRHELAQLLGYPSYAQYIVEDKMIKTADDIQQFVDKIAAIAKPGADKEYDELIKYKQKEIDPHASIILGHESSFVEEGYKLERFGFDSQEVRPYFSYLKVRDGLLQVTGELFDISYVKIADAKVWHQDVDTYDVYDRSGKIGRIHLDMHPRDAKYSHAAQFTVRNGIRDRQLPQAVLVCNFPNPKDGDGRALMEHGDVVTFFHEFGHLLHHIFAGKHEWAPFSGVATEWDFVEAPSQLLEEWAWSPEVLATFAHHYETNQPIPKDLVSKMRAAEEFGKAISVRQQMFYAGLSVNFYNADPATFDPLHVLKQMQARYSYFPYEEGTHFHHNFGHLDGYSAMYYTYMWSLSLAKDLFEPFREAGLMNKDVAARYRNLILERGGSQDASVLVEDFLGRPFEFDAFEKWLTRGADNDTIDSQLRAGLFTQKIIDL